MKRILRATATAALLLGLLSSGSALALEGSVESVASLADFTGLWAHSEADCKEALSGRLDEVDRVTSSSYELVGICADSVDMLHQPVNCGVSGIVKQEDLIEFSAACRIKDYVADRRERVLIKVQDVDTILFADPKFMIFGRYQRCTRDYKCEKAWNTE